MDKGKHVIIDSLLTGFNGVLFDCPDMLAYTVQRLTKRYIESHKDAGRKVTSKSYLAAIGALRDNSLKLVEERLAMETELDKERKEKAAKKAGKK